MPLGVRKFPLILGNQSSVVVAPPGGAPSESVGPIQGLESLGVPLLHEEQGSVGLVEARRVGAGPQRGLHAAVGPGQIAAPGGHLHGELNGVHVVRLCFQR